MMFAPANAWRRGDIAWYKHAIPLRPVGEAKLREDEESIILAMLLAAEC